MKSLLTMLLTIICVELTAQKFATFNVYFETGSASLSQKEKYKIDSLLLRIQDGTVFDIKATGHTDKRGSFLFNKDLSEKRANTVVAYIRKKIKNSSIQSEGRSFSDLAYKGEETDEFEKNRRVQIEFSYAIPKVNAVGNETLQTEKFTLSNGSDDSLVTKSGTVIHIPANAFQ